MRGGLDLNTPPSEDEKPLSAWQLTRLGLYINRRLGRIVVIGAVVLTAIAASTATYAVVSTLQRNEIREAVALIEENQEAAEDQVLLNLVANCAFLNIAQNLNKDMVLRMEKYGVQFATETGRKAFYAETLPEFQQVDCKALVPKKDQANITLDYPTTLPPNTSIPHNK